MIGFLGFCDWVAWSKVIKTLGKVKGALGFRAWGFSGPRVHGAYFLIYGHVNT